MMTQESLKERLRAIASADYQVPEPMSPFELALEMMPYIGSTDSELRDDLIYGTMARWIRRQLFTQDQLRQILTTALDDGYLFYRAGHQGDDSVFTRSFSILLVPPILSVHRQHPFLTSEGVRLIEQRILDYIRTEADLRGYVEDKGWAHALAHAADALEALAEAQELEAEDLRQILAVIRDRIIGSQQLFAHEEDERLAVAATSALHRHLLPEPEVIDWIAGLTPFGRRFEPMPAGYYRAVNVKQFLRSLYFQARRRQLADAVRRALVDALEEINRF